MRVLEIPQRWQGRAIVIAWGAGDLARAYEMAWFSEDEVRAAERYRLQRRRDEFFLSRAAAKTLAVDVGLAADPRECRIEQRRIADRHLSLSHSAPYAGAAIDSQPVGIDVQVVRDISENAAHLFLTDAEADVMRSLSIAHRMIHFWSAKEAAWKQRGGAIETLKRVPISLQTQTAEGLRFDSVETVRIGDVVVALTLPTS